MARLPTLAIRFCFRDRDASRAKMTIYCAASIADPYTFGAWLADRIKPLSNATLDRIEYTWRYTVDSPALASFDADLQRKLLLLIINDLDEINGIVIPSPADVFELAGDYAGIRLDLASAGAIGIADMLLAMPFVTDDDRTLGTVIAAGGLAI